MPATPSECASSAPDGTNGATTCTLELTSDVIPSIQYQCGSDGQVALKSVMVHATDPESGVRAPFKLEPGKSCEDICNYHLGGSGFQVKDLVLHSDGVKLGNSVFKPDPFLCKEGS